MFDAKALEITLWSSFNKENVCQFLINLLFLSFFSISFLVACLHEVLHSYVLQYNMNLKKTSFILPQKFTKNSFVSPSFQGVLLFCILIKDMYNPFSDSSLSYSLISIIINFGSWTLSRKSSIWDGDFESPLLK